MNYNKVVLIGHLTKDIESGFTTGGTAFAKSGIAVNNGYGEKKTVTFIDFVTWGKTSEFLAKHFSKGKCILIEGELKLETWEKDGKKNYKHTINVQSVGFAGGDKDKKEDTTATQTENKPVSADEEADISF